MSPQEQPKKIPIEEQLLAPFLVLLIGELTGWNAPIEGGDPVYFTGEQTESLAAEGIRLLAQYLPERFSQQVASAVEPLPRPPHGSPEQRLMRIGRLGGIIPTVISNPGGNNAPGCCVWMNGHMYCVR